jgi:hypothetical protein
MDKSGDWKHYVRALIYPIQFEADPVQGVDHVIKLVVRGGALGGSAAVYLASVRVALASSIRLSALIPQDHSEAEIRRFLAEVERRLETMAD